LLRRLSGWVVLVDHAAEYSAASDELRVWVPQTRLTSCDLLIFVEKAREPVESADASRVIWPLFWERA
jgi:hypothetical protein